MDRFSPEPISPTPGRRRRGARIIPLLLALVGISIAARGDTLQRIWEVLAGQEISVAGPPVAATHAKLSEHNIEWVETQPPQVQAEFLLAAAINHERGATDLIEAKVEGWRGKLERTPKWESLTQTALYSNDLRVRAAAIEIDLAVHKVAKTDAMVEWLIEMDGSRTGDRSWAHWTLGMLANRGLQPERIHQLLVEATYDPEEEIRIWAVEGLAHIGSDATIPEFIRILGTDPALKVRERAGCSLAKSGMLTRAQRMKAVPGLIELAEDPSVEGQPLRWVYQALREITNVSLPDDPERWRYWHSTEGYEATKAFESHPSRVLGNS